MRMFVHSFCILLLVGCDNSRQAMHKETWAQPVAEITATQLYEITPHVYHCFEPSAGAILQAQEKLHIRSVISLRAHHNMRDELTDLPLHINRIKMYPGQVDAVAVKEVLTVIRNAPKPILLSSWDAPDGVAITVAVYRIAEQHWSITDALDELQYGNYKYQDPLSPRVIEWFENGGVQRLQP